MIEHFNQVTTPELFVLRCVMKLSQNNNEKIGFADFRGYNVYEIASLGQRSVTQVRNLLLLLEAKGLIFAKNIGKTPYFFPNLTEKDINLEEIDRILGQKITEENN